MQPCSRAVITAAAVPDASKDLIALHRHTSQHMSCTCKLSEPCSLLSGNPFQQGQAGKRTTLNFRKEHTKDFVRCASLIHVTLSVSFKAYKAG